MRRHSWRRLPWLAMLCGLQLAVDAHAADPAPLNVLTSISVNETEAATEVVVTGSQKPKFTVFKLTDPVRLFVDVSHADISALSKLKVDNGVVTTVAPVQDGDAVVDVGRIVVGLAQDTPYQVRAQGSKLVIKVDAAARKQKRPMVSAAAGGGEALQAALLRAQKAETQAQAAEAREAEALAQAATAREAEARAQAAEARAAAAEARAAEAEARAAAVEGTAASATALAERRAQEAEARAREAAGRAEASAVVAAQARQQALAAETRARAAQERAQQVAADGAGATVELTAVEARAIEAEQRAADAEKRVRRAEEQVAEARAAQARAEKAEAAARAAESKAQKAEARAEKAEARAAKAEREAAGVQDRVAEAERKARQAAEKAAADRVAEAERKARQAAEKAAADRVAEAERKAREAAERARGAEKALAEAKVAAGQRKADPAAQKQLEEATTRAREAEARARSADQALAEAKAARARAEQAEARLGEVERERARLARQLQDLEKERTGSQGRIEALEAGRGQLERELAQARAAKDDARTRELEAQSQARAAELEKMRAEAAQLNERLAARDKELETARQEAERLRAEARQQATAAAAAPPPAAAAPAAERVRVTNVEFVHDGNGSHIHVTVTGNPKFEVRPGGERTRILQFENALIDPAIERSLDTSGFEGAVQLISSFQAPPPGDRVNVVVTLGAEAADRVTQRKNRLTWTFARPQGGAPVAAVPPAPAWTGTAEPPRSTEIPFDQARAAVYSGPTQQISVLSQQREQIQKKRKRYTGKKINIDIKDGDIHNVLRLLAKEGNVNIVTSDDVSGTVTLHLRLVPWDQALDIILRSKGLGMVREGDIIRVAPAEMLDAERKREIEAITVEQKLEPLQVKLVSVNHATAGELLPRVRSVLSDRGAAEFDGRTNTVIVKDVADHVEAAEDIIRRLDTQTPLVLIEARIVEVNTVNALQLGIQWGVDALWTAATGNPTGLAFPSTVGIRGAADDRTTPTEGVSSNPNFVVNLPAAVGAGSGGALGLTFGSIDSTFNLNVRLSAFENRGTVKIVSSPKITTLDNKPAKISQGVSIPISQVSAAGVQTIFFDAVLALEVTPHVTQDGNIYLKIRAENNTPDFQNVGARGDPTILKKEAETELLLKDGDTTVIGGIYTSNSGFSRSEIPYLARIPILGAIFRNYQESDRRTELLIFVTPRIVNRSAAMVRTAAQ